MMILTCECKLRHIYDGLVPIRCADGLRLMPGQIKGGPSDPMPRHPIQATGCPERSGLGSVCSLKSNPCSTDGRHQSVLTSRVEIRRMQNISSSSQDKRLLTQPWNRVKKYQKEEAELSARSSVWGTNGELSFLGKHFELVEVYCDTSVRRRASH